MVFFSTQCLLERINLLDFGFSRCELKMGERMCSELLPSSSYIVCTSVSVLARACGQLETGAVVMLC